jgi:hypothetical protein
VSCSLGRLGPVRSLGSAKWNSAFLGLQKLRKEWPILPLDVRLGGRVRKILEKLIPNRHRPAFAKSGGNQLGFPFSPALPFNISLAAAPT